MNVRKLSISLHLRNFVSNAHIQNHKRPEDCIFPCLAFELALSFGGRNYCFSRILLNREAINAFFHALRKALFRIFAEGVFDERIGGAWINFSRHIVALRPNLSGAIHVRLSHGLRAENKSQHYRYKCPHLPPP